MRLLSAVLFVALTGSIGLAEDAPPPPPAPDAAKPAEAKPEAHRNKVPLRVVKLLPETRQVLLLDKNKGSHVVAEVGQDVEGYVVDEIGDDEVTLIAANGTEVILAAPEPAWRRRAAAAPAKAATGVKQPGVTAAPAVAAEPAPVDPYADPVDEPAPVTPGADGVRVASASPELDPGIAAFVAAVNDDAPATTVPAVATPAPAVATPAPAAATAAPAVATPAVAAPAVTPGPTTATIKRAEIDAALADFATTASTFRATFTRDGLRFDDVTSGSLLARVGVVKGDIVTSVDGQPLRSLDDAANLYARLPTARGTTLQVTRAGKPVTLRVSIQ